MPEQSAKEALFCFALPLLLFCALFFALNLGYFRHSCERGGDYHLIALETVKTNREAVLLGPYSRFGFRHPGPIFFYYYAAVSRLAPFAATSHGAYSFGQFVLNMLLLAAALRIVFNQVRPALLTPLLLLFFSISCIYAREGVLRDIWNPAVVMVPGFALFAASAALAMGRFEAALLAAAALVLASSAHIGAALVLPPACLTALGLGILTRAKQREVLSVRERASIFGALLLIFAAAAPALWEAWRTPEGGNLGAILAFARNNVASGGKTAVEALSFIGSFYIEPAGKVFYRNPVFCIFALCVLLVWLWRARFGAAVFLSKLRIVVTVGIIFCFLSALGIRGRPHQYLLMVMYAIAALHCWLIAAGIVCSLSQKTVVLNITKSRAAKPLALVFICLALAASAWFQRAKYSICVHPEGYLTDKLSLSKDRIYRVKPYDNTLWEVMARVVLDAYRRGISICVPQDWGFMFGSSMICGENISPSPDHTETLRLCPRYKCKTALQAGAPLVGNAVVITEHAGSKAALPP